MLACACFCAALKAHSKINSSIEATRRVAMMLVAVQHVPVKSSLSPVTVIVSPRPSGMWAVAKTHWRRLGTATLSLLIR
jgi:hypothetical protein